MSKNFISIFLGIAVIASFSFTIYTIYPEFLEEKFYDFRNEIQDKFEKNDIRTEGFSYILKKQEKQKKIKSLPYISNNGMFVNFHDAVKADKTGEMKKLLKLFVASDTTDEMREEITERLLIKWVGAENTEKNARGENVDARHLAVVEKFIGQPFVSSYEKEQENPHPENPNPAAGQFLETAYQRIKLFAFSELAYRAFLNDLTPLIRIRLDKYFFNENIVGIDISKVTEKFKKELKQNPERAKKRIYYFSAYFKSHNLLSYVTEQYFDALNDECFYSLFTSDDRELKRRIDMAERVPYDLTKREPSSADDGVYSEENEALTDFHSMEGDDTVYGSRLADNFLSGSGDDIIDSGDGDDSVEGCEGNDLIYTGNGNDTIFGGEGDDVIFSGDGNDMIYPDKNYDVKNAQGNDIINPGKGNDRVFSFVGDDTYIFNFNDGKDVITDKNGNDTFYFGKGITFDMLMFLKSGKDLIIGIKGADNNITVKNFFDKNNDYKIETYHFSENNETYYSPDVTIRVGE